MSGNSFFAKLGVFALIAANIGAYYVFWPENGLRPPAPTRLAGRRGTAEDVGRAAEHRDEARGRRTRRACHTGSPAADEAGEQPVDGGDGDRRRADVDPGEATSQARPAHPVRPRRDEG